LFEEWLARHLPAKKDKVLHRLRALRRGKLNNSEFGLRMTGEGIIADQFSRRFDVACRKAGWSGHDPELSVAYLRRPGGSQMELSLPTTGPRKFDRVQLTPCSLPRTPWTDVRERKRDNVGSFPCHARL
jgi:hypothetical protein